MACRRMSGISRRNGSGFKTGISRSIESIFYPHKEFIFFKKQSGIIMVRNSRKETTIFDRRLLFLFVLLTVFFSLKHLDYWKVILKSEEANPPTKHIHLD
jgi:hypothetical protein